MTMIVISILIPSAELGVVVMRIVLVGGTGGIPSRLYTYIVSRVWSDQSARERREVE